MKEKADAAEAALTSEQKADRKKAQEAENERAEAALQAQLKEQAAEKIYAHVRGHHTRIQKRKPKRGGTRRRRRTRRRRGGNPKFRTQKSPYLTYDKHLSEADAAKEAAQVEEDRQHADETRKKYIALAEKLNSPTAVRGAYTIHRLRGAHKRKTAKGQPI